MKRNSIVLITMVFAVAVINYLGGIIRWQKCDAIGNTCCGADTEVKTRHCHKGLGCNITTDKCAPCGAPGQPCCDGDYTGFSMKGYTGILLDSSERIESCNAGARCDARLAANGKDWEGTRMCLACGTKEGGHCCAPDVRYALGRCFDDAATGKRLACNDPWAGAQGYCVPCGSKIGEIACPSGYPCDEGMTDQNGVCVACGYPGMPVCDRGAPCRDQSVPNKSHSMCIPAGGAGQPCLGNGRCSYQRLFCNSAKICEHCGSGGELCCPPSEGAACEVGECRENRCFACGYINMPVCAGSDPCPYNGEPYNGRCVPCGKQNQRCCYGLSIRCEDGMRCQDGGICKGSGGGGGSSGEQWKTCSGQPWTWSTQPRVIWIEDAHGCVAAGSYVASTPEEALQCARNQHGEKAIGPSIGTFPFAVTCPSTGCNQVTYNGRDHDGAEDCVKATWLGCTVDDGACP